MTLINYMNRFNNFLYGRPIEKFVSKVVSNPFKARNDIQLQEHYAFYREKRHVMLLNKSQRILLNFILMRDYETVINELPHFFYLTLKHNCPIYSVPSFPGLNPEDHKSGDFVVDHSGVYVESKTYAVLREKKLYDIQLQYALNKINSKLCLNILYESMNSDFVIKNYFSSLKELNFQQDNINILSLNDLQLYHTEANILQFFKTYNMSWFTYRDIQYSYIEDQLKDIINFSENKNAVTLCQKYLRSIEEEKFRQKLVSFDKQKKIKSRFMQDFDLSEVDTIYYDNMSDSETPEDFMVDVIDWFSED